MKSKKVLKKLLALMCVFAMLAFTGCSDEDYSDYDQYDENGEYAEDGDYSEDKEYSKESEESASAEKSDNNKSGNQNLGSASELEGRTVVVSVFANDNSTSWDGGNDQLKSNSLQYLGMAADWITKQAAKYDCNAEFIYDWKENQDLYYEGNINGDIAGEGDDMDSSSWEFIANNIDSDAIKANYQADNMIYMIILNTDENHTLTSSTRNYYEGMEYPYEMCFMYSMIDGMEEGPAMYAHEMLHTFGAPDLYEEDTYGDNYGVPKKLVKSYEKNNSNDIMYTVYDIDNDNYPNYDRITNEFTELDAYYVGLTDKSSEAEKWGLQPSQH